MPSINPKELFQHRDNSMIVKVISVSKFISNSMKCWAITYRQYDTESKDFFPEADTYTLPIEEFKNRYSAIQTRSYKESSDFNPLFGDIHSNTYNDLVQNIFGDIFKKR